jgi:hypothetical protein
MRSKSVNFIWSCSVCLQVFKLSILERMPFLNIQTLETLTPNNTNQILSTRQSTLWTIWVGWKFLSYFYIFQSNLEIIKTTKNNIKACVLDTIPMSSTWVKGNRCSMTVMCVLLWFFSLVNWNFLLFCGRINKRKRKVTFTWTKQMKWETKTRKDRTQLLHYTTRKKLENRLANNKSFGKSCVWHEWRRS